jgi:DNA-binding NarL/FixJ family response regulator
MPAPQHQIRVLLVDPHPVVRAGLRLLLDSRPGLTVVSETTTPAEAVMTASREQADIVLVDENLTERSVDALLPLVRACHPAHVIVFTDNHGDVADERAAVRAGVKGLVRKDASLDTLINAIEKVHAGEVWLPRALLASVLSDLARTNGHAQTSVARSGLPSLTRREIEIIGLICDGLTNQQLADRLFISETTVRHHLTSIFAKLNVRNRLGLAVYAHRHGLAAAPAEAAVGQHTARHTSHLLGAPEIRPGFAGTIRPPARMGAPADAGKGRAAYSHHDISSISTSSAARGQPQDVEGLGSQVR